MRTLTSLSRLIGCWMLTIFCGLLAVIGVGVSFKPRFVSWVGRRIWGPSLLWVLGVKLEVIHNENVDFSKPNVFFMNHQSTIDILVAFAAVPADIYFVAKKEFEMASFRGLGHASGRYDFCRSIVANPSHREHDASGSGGSRGERIFWYTLKAPGLATANYVRSKKVPS